MNTFMIAGPSTVTLSVGYEVGGSTAQAAGKAITLQTQCLTDTFSVTGSAGSNPPVICGTNSGYHGKLTTHTDAELWKFLLLYFCREKKKLCLEFWNTVSIKLMRLGVTNQMVDDSDSKPVNFNRWFWSDSKSNDGFESSIAILINSQLFST